jgi:hypothetical protein
MACWCTDTYLRLAAVALWLWASALSAAEYRGQVTFGGLPVPGATVTATVGDKKLVAITDLEGIYVFPDLPDGNWMIEIQMLGFETVRNTAPSSMAATWELKLLPLDRIKAQVQTAAAFAPPPTAPAPPAPAKDLSAEDMSQRAADGFLINGSSQNGAASPFAQLAAFGNNRNGSKGLYNGGIGLTFDNSALDAQQFSLTGQDTPKLAYDRLTGMAFLGGPLQIRPSFQTPPVFLRGVSVDAEQQRHHATRSDAGPWPSATEYSRARFSIPPPECRSPATSFRRTGSALRRKLC